MNWHRDYSFHRQLRRTLSRHAQAGDVLQWYIVGEFTWSVFRQAQTTRLAKRDSSLADRGR